MFKGKLHRSCSCAQCKRGRASEAGQFVRNQNERKLRRKTKQALREVVKGGDDAVVAPISSPYTD